MTTGEGARGSAVPEADARRRSPRLQSVTPRPTQRKLSVTPKRMVSRSKNAAEPEVQNPPETRVDTRNEHTPSRAEHVAEKEAQSPRERRADTRYEHTPSRAAEEARNPPEPRRTISMNLTEIAQMCNETPGDDEAESSCTLEAFRGYKVSQEVVPMLTQIFNKYGDIAKDSISSAPKVLAFFLEELSRTMERLKSTKFEDLSLDSLEQMCGSVEAMEKMSFNVGWLKTKLTNIKEVKAVVANYTVWKADKTTLEQKKAVVANYTVWKADKTTLEQKKAELEKKRTELAVLREEVRLLEDRNKETDAKMEKVKPIFHSTYTSSCADGLL